jgi:hypothetical protein
LVPVSHTVLPVQAPEVQGHPNTSLLQAWHNPMPSQYAAPSHAGAEARQGQAGDPATQVSATQVPLLHSRPVPQVSPGPQAQPVVPAGQVSQSPVALHRRPALQVLFERHVQSASPRWQATQVPLMHSPCEQAPAAHSQPGTPEHPASTTGVPESGVAGGCGQPRRHVARVKAGSQRPTASFRAYGVMVGYPT